MLENSEALKFKIKMLWFLNYIGLNSGIVGSDGKESRKMEDFFYTK